MINLHHILNLLKSRNRLILNIVLLFSVLLQFGYLTHAISQNARSWALVKAKDDDAANAVAVSQRSTWYNNNRFYAYGNLYFRIAGTIEQFNPLTQSGIGSFEEAEKSHHFSLMLVSLISMMLVSFFLARLITYDFIYQLFSMFCINCVFMFNAEWMNWIFRAHPDLLLCLFILLALVMSVRYLVNRQEGKYFIASAVFWGLALATKMSAVFFLVMTVLFFIPPFKKDAFFRMIRYYCIILGTYFAVGFYQNFMVWKTIGFLSKQSQYSVAPTLQSLGSWWGNLFDQSWLLVVTIALLVLLFSVSREKVPNKVLVKTGLVVLFPYIYFLSHRITAPYDHYTLPVVIGLLVVLISFLKNIKLRYFSKSDHFKVLSSDSISFTLICILVIVFLNNISNAVPGIVKKELHCSGEAVDVLKSIEKYQKQNRKIIIDPYVPGKTGYGLIRSSWHTKISDIINGEVSVLVLNKRYYKRYISKKGLSKYVKTYSKEPTKVRDFYLLFDTDENMLDVSGQNWKRVYRDTCGWTIWERVE